MKYCEVGLKSGKVVSGVEFENEDSLYEWFGMLRIKGEKTFMMKNEAGEVFMVFGMDIEYVKLQA